MGDADRILVVDDEPQVRNALARTVRRLGGTPIVAASAEEAIALSEGQRFSVVVSDLQMPGMGGLALLQRLSPIQPEARFIVVTGIKHVDANALPRGHRTKVLKKPWNEEELTNVILGSRTNMPSSIPPSRSSERAVGRVLLLEDDRADALLFEAALRLSHPGQFQVTHAYGLEDAQELLAKQEFDVVTVDLGLGELSGLQTVARVQAAAPHLGLVVLSGTDDPDLALQSVQVGAQDYLVKGRVGGGTIGRALRYAEERKRAELRLSDIAFHDQLTGLANRPLFRQRIAQALTRSRRTGSVFAVLLLDMDRFKAVNDALGHDAGDIFLRHVAERLRRATRETDTVARLGGDEFAILAEPVATAQDVASLATRVLEALREPVCVSGAELTPTASIGAAVYPDSGEDGDALIAAADAAMYAAKDEGRNKFHVHGAHLSQRIQRRLELETALRGAVGSGALILHYQPQLALDGSFISAEALLRWPNGEAKPMEAHHFIPVLEDSGLIVKLGPWILRTACQQLATWRRAGYEVRRIAVNLSAKQLSGVEVVEDIRRATQEAGLRPQDIELELTETTLFGDSHAIADALQALHEEGYRLALDDFGTGYSSLAHLEAFPIDSLKIDRSFVCEATSDEFKRNLVGGLIQLARRLGLEVVAEGVETSAQQELLRAEGCHAVQGFLTGVPMPAAEFEGVLRLRAAATECPLPRIASRPA